MKADARGSARMVEARRWTTDAIAAMMARIDAVPMMHTIAIEVQRMETGLCVAKVPRRLEWDGIYETFHGGMLGVIADSVTCWAILTTIGADEKVATTDFNIRFLRPCHTDVVCTAHRPRWANDVRRGRRHPRHERQTCRHRAGVLRPLAVNLPDDGEGSSPDRPRGGPCERPGFAPPPSPCWSSAPRSPVALEATTTRLTSVKR